MPGDLPDSGIEPVFLASPALAGGFFTTAPPGILHILKYRCSILSLKVFEQFDYFFFFKKCGVTLFF